MHLTVYPTSVVVLYPTNYSIFLMDIRPDAGYGTESGSISGRIFGKLLPIAVVI
jgi:hypothetical protein